jgi:riboflavin biosynthesis pyrimidine reductase
MGSLLNAGLVDEVRMLVRPASRGTGPRLFEDRRNLILLEGTWLTNGVALLRYGTSK